MILRITHLIVIFFTIINLSNGANKCTLDENGFMVRNILIIIFKIYTYKIILY